MPLVHTFVHSMLGRQHCPQSQFYHRNPNQKSILVNCPYFESLRRRLFVNSGALTTWNWETNWAWRNWKLEIRRKFRKFDKNSTGINLRQLKDSYPKSTVIFKLLQLLRATLEKGRFCLNRLFTKLYIVSARSSYPPVEAEVGNELHSQITRPVGCRFSYRHCTSKSPEHKGSSTNSITSFSIFTQFTSSTRSHHHQQYFFSVLTHRRTTHK